MPRLRAVWATAQLVLAVATLAWGAYLLFATREVVWGSGNFAAGVFFLVTVFLFAANHDDGRIVGLFGLAVFLITNFLLVFALLGPEGLPRLAIAPDWTRTQVALVMSFGAALVAVPEALLLLFGHGPRRPTADAMAEAQPPM